MITHSDGKPKWSDVGAQLTPTVSFLCAAARRPLVMALLVFGLLSGALAMGVPSAFAEDGLPPGVPVPAWAVGKHVHFYPPPSQRASVVTSEEALSPQLASPAVTQDCPNGGKLCYWGGPVQHEPQLFVIFWGEGFEQGPPGGEELTDLRDFYLGLEENKGEPGEKAWQGTISQYFDNEGPGSRKAKVVVLTVVPNSPGEITNATVEAKITELVKNEREKGVNPSAEAQYIVLPQPGTSYSHYEQMAGNCGFHGVDNEGFSYSVVAYAGDVGCGGGEGDLAETSGAAAHEFAESATDPSIEEPGKNYTSRIGWAKEEAGNVEVADLCEEFPAEKPKNDFWWAVKLWDDLHENKCQLEDPPYPPPPAPSATTEGATGITATGATVAGSVNPNGPDAHYYFEYGPTTSYGTKIPTPPGNNAGFGTTAVPASVKITGLQVGTVYHYRLVASSWVGTTDGADHTFTTTAKGTLSAGGYHTCALLSGRSIKCWGENYYGELGNGTTKNISTTPVAVSGIANASEVSAGGFHTCALLSTKSVDCWGYNKVGELGNGTTTSSATPLAVSGITNATEVSGGDFYTCALLSTKSIDCWGENGFGELGDGTFTERTTPVAVHGITNAIEVSAGTLSTCALLSGGSIDCWGYNGFGELGTGSTVPEYSPTPVAVKGITNAVAVTVGDFYTCALLSTGSIDCWGDNEDGELGNGTTVNSTTPVQVSGITNSTEVSGGDFHTCALLSVKSLKCWGENYFGELGNGTTVNSSTPVAVTGITNATGVDAGTSHTCARLSGGKIDCWGENLSGQLGNGTTMNSTTPVAVSGIP